VVVVGLTMPAAALMPGTARAQDDLMGEIKTVASVRFEGRRRVSARELRSVIKTRSPSIWPWRDRPVVRADFLRSDTLAIRDRYRLHGFLDASVGVVIASTRDSGRVAVTFLIREGPQTRVARVEFPGVRSYPENQLRRRLITRPGEPFDPFALQLDTLRISELYQERGFRPWVVARAWRGEGADSVRARVEFEVDEGNRYRVGQVYVHTGDPRPRVAEPLLRRELMLRPGDFYRRSFMIRSWERLYDTGLFSQVQISPIVDSERDSIDFQISVRERKPRWVDAGVGSGTAERYRVIGEWGHRNLLGRGLQGAFGARLAANGSGQFLLARGEASLLAPWMFGRRIRGVMTPFYERADDRTDPAWLVAQHLRGVRFELRRELNRFSRVVLTQDNVWVRQSLTQFADSLSPDTIAAKQASVVPKYSTHSLSLGGEWDYRDNPFHPLTGSYHAATVVVHAGSRVGAGDADPGRRHGADRDGAAVLASRRRGSDRGARPARGPLQGRRRELDPRLRGQPDPALGRPGDDRRQRRAAHPAGGPLRRRGLPRPRECLGATGVPQGERLRARHQPDAARRQRRPLRGGVRAARRAADRSGAVRRDLGASPAPGRDRAIPGLSVRDRTVVLT
jgi:outer membrane protein assembly factor BamA